MKLTFKVNKPCDEILPYLTDMTKFVTVNPVIRQIDHLGENKYFSHETLKVGFIPFSFTYPFTVDCNPESKTVMMRAIIMGMIKIEISFILNPDPDCTTVEETVEFTTFLPVKTMMARIFEKQHTLLFKNIEASS